MEWNGVILNNKILDVVFIAWFLAQAWKVVETLIFHKKINFKRFIETGGMPSSHTSSVISLLTMVGLVEGISSTYFAVTSIFALIVMYDAAGVRRAAGKQAAVLNKMVENIKNKDGKKIIDENLKELLGHTPKEVLAGAVLGVVVAVIMHNLFF